MENDIALFELGRPDPITFVVLNLGMAENSSWDSALWDESVVD
jgi:hypothetical protein